MPSLLLRLLGGLLLAALGWLVWPQGHTRPLALPPTPATTSYGWHSTH